ncbi:MAG: hypothetical protein JWM28_2707 [Chitinophagaceae bacterium]|nr:hypothetical protein [Chitinophagaceae bacterium]
MINKACGLAAIFFQFFSQHAVARHSSSLQNRVINDSVLGIH